MQSVAANHGGYFPAQIRTGNNSPVFSLILLDTGNNIKYDAAVKKEFAEKLNCNILAQPMQIGLAAESLKIQACGITNIDIRFIMEDNSFKVFSLTTVVVEELQDNLNVSITWLKKNSVKLHFSIENPIIMEFPDNKCCLSVAQMKQQQQAIDEPCQNISNAKSQHCDDIKDWYEIKMTSQTYVFPNSISHVPAHIPDLPSQLQNNCLLVTADIQNPENYEIAGGLVSRILPPGTSKLEFKTLDTGFQLDKNEIIGFAKVLLEDDNYCPFINRNKIITSQQTF